MNKNFLLLSMFVLLAAAASTGCAPMVASTSASMETLSTSVQARDIRLLSPASVKFSTGYARTLSPDIRWRPVGQVPQGIVYRPVETTFSIEGRQVHEAYLVIEREKSLAGFYLPAESRYSPLEAPIILTTQAFP